MLDSTPLVPLKLEMEPLPVLARTSALNTGSFPKLTPAIPSHKNPFTFRGLVREEQQRKHERKRDADEDVM